MYTPAVRSVTSVDSADDNWPLSGRQLRAFGGFAPAAGSAGKRDKPAQALDPLESAAAASPQLKMK